MKDKPKNGQRVLTSFMLDENDNSRLRKMARANEISLSSLLRIFVKERLSGKKSRIAV